MSLEIIFVGGIHAVGKTEFCKSIAKGLDVDIVSASGLIRQMGTQPSNQHKQVDKVVERGRVV